MRVAIVLTFSIPDANVLPGVLTCIDPTNIPYFDGTTRVVAEPAVSELIAWLDEPAPQGTEPSGDS